MLRVVPVSRDTLRRHHPLGWTGSFEATLPLSCDVANIPVKGQPVSARTRSAVTMSLSNIRIPFRPWRIAHDVAGTNCFSSNGYLATLFCQTEVLPPFLQLSSHYVAPIGHLLGLSERRSRERGKCGGVKALHRLFPHTRLTYIYTTIRPRNIS